MKHNAVYLIWEIYIKSSVSAADKSHILSEYPHTSQFGITAFQSFYAQCDKQDVQENIRHQVCMYEWLFCQA